MQTHTITFSWKCERIFSAHTTIVLPTNLAFITHSPFPFLSWSVSYFIQDRIEIEIKPQTVPSLR